MVKSLPVPFLSVNGLIRQHVGVVNGTARKTCLYARCSNGTNQQGGKKSIWPWSIVECVGVHKDMLSRELDGTKQNLARMPCIMPCVDCYMYACDRHSSLLYKGAPNHTTPRLCLTVTVFVSSRALAGVTSWLWW